jgi:hypothetical protein
VHGHGKPLTSLRSESSAGKRNERFAWLDDIVQSQVGMKLVRINAINAFAISQHHSGIITGLSVPWQ